MYQLYYYPLNASMAPHMILEALQVDYRLIKVDRKNQEQKSKEYLALNPAGRIPTLVKGELILCESAAICLHLGEMHPEVKLIPEIGDKSRALHTQWLMYLTNTLQAELMVYFYPEKHCQSEKTRAEIVTAQQELIHQSLSLLDEQLVNKDYLIANKISVCDYYLFMLLIWADELEQPPLSFIHLERYLRCMAKNSAVITVCQKENLSLVDYQ
ncbi:glutathione S-transferase family protein [Colwellia psychrerythraea]|uniref:Glutathione S-transferase domain-containing protein n=1 Tax=Colwellia psychrerythraea TaxID=28229 RepID=A0A099KQR8_COLPS|nr:glutathione S-transferase family protein [Colwellia psychrerythraea]KGJ92856.1 Glutathione S-transferase domain-containing protein [Colwellia psychrerythraea]